MYLRWLMAKCVDSKKKPLFYRFIRSCIRVFIRKREFIGTEHIGEDCVVIGNHAQLYSPFICESYFPKKKYIWCIGQMMKFKEVPKYAFEDFWSHKPRWNRWFFKIVSYLIAPFSVYVFNRADAIGVYHDARVISTFKESVKRLEEGACIIIFPEKREEFNNIVNDFQDKFVDLARLYYKKTGRCLKFVPMYNAVKLKKVIFGEAISFDPNMNIDDQRKLICDYLKREITNLAISLPKHKVIPYLNVKKKYYKYNKED